MEVKLFDSELKVMDLLWKEGDLTAKAISEILKESVGWSKTTTYTVIKKCIDKGAIERRDPKFVCHPLILKEQVQEMEIDELIDKLYDGAADQLVAAIINQKKLTKDEIQQLKLMVQNLQ